MNYVELSIKNTEEDTLKVAKLIDSNFVPEIVVFISKGSYIIGKTFSNYYNVPLIEIFAVREGNKLKEVVGPLLKIIPKRLKNYLREKELNSGIHKKNNQRHVYISKGESFLKNSSNILVVDDSVDTGHTAKQVVDFIESKYGNSKSVKFASLNFFEDSLEVFKVDYTLYENTILIGPWSKDSSYYKEFINQYNKDKKKGVF